VTVVGAAGFTGALAMAAVLPFAAGNATFPVVLGVAALAAALTGCEQAPNRDPAEIGSTALYARRKTSQGRGPGRRRPGPRQPATSRRGNQQVASAFGRGPGSALVHSGLRPAPPSRTPLNLTVPVHHINLGRVRGGDPTIISRLCSLARTCPGSRRNSPAWGLAAKSSADRARRRRSGCAARCRRRCRRAGIELSR